MDSSDLIILRQVTDDHTTMLHQLSDSNKQQSAELNRHIHEITQLLQSMSKQVTSLNRQVTVLQEDVERLKAGKCTLI